MEFNLERDLIFFDIESTGLDVIRDRIIQLAMIKYFKDGRPEETLEMLINPGAVPISKEAYEVHGISAQDVANKPTFKEVAQRVYDFIEGCDLAGYNIQRFDVPMLMEELARAGFTMDLSKVNIIDVQRIFYKMEPRHLAAAHRFYCGEEMENAHDALADVKATVNVLKGQLSMYKDRDMIDKDGQVIPAPVQNDMSKLHAFTNDSNTLDATRRLRRDSNGVIVFNFGKYINQPVGESMYKDRNYYNWIQQKEFSTQMKQMVKKLLDEYIEKQKK